MAGRGLGFSVDASGAAVKVGRLQAGLQVRLVLEAVGAKLLYWTGMNLQEAGRVQGGTPWQQMAPLTLRLRPVRRSSYHFSSPYQALLQQSMRSVVEEGRGTVTVGTGARYAGEHHFGVPSRNLPARPLVPRPEVARVQAVETVQAIIDKVVRDAG